MSDKVFKGNRGATGVFFMTLVTIATVVYWLNPPGNPGIDMTCMIVIGFLIYGPVMLIGLHALELAPKSGWHCRRFYRFIWLPAVPLPPARSSAIPLTSSAGTAVSW